MARPVWVETPETFNVPTDEEAAVVVAKVEVPDTATVPEKVPMAALRVPVVVKPVKPLPTPAPLMSQMLESNTILSPLSPMVRVPVVVRVPLMLFEPMVPPLIVRMSETEASERPLVRFKVPTLAVMALSVPTEDEAAVVVAKVEVAITLKVLESVVAPVTARVPVNEAALEIVWPLIAPLVRVPFKIWLPETFNVPIEEEPEKNVVAVRTDEEALPKVARPVTPRVLANDAAPVWALVPEIVVEPAAVVKPGATSVVPSNVKVVEVASEFVALV